MTIYLGSKKVGNSINKHENKLVDILNNTIEELTEQDFGNVSTIYDRMLYNTTSLKKVSLPDSVYIIEDDAFNGCTSLENVKFPKHLNIIGYYAFSKTKMKEVVLPEGLEEMDNSVFYKSSVEKLVLPSTLKKIYSLSYMPELKGELIIPELVTEINDYFLIGCDKLESLIFLGDIKHLGNSSCSLDSVKTITLPPKLESSDYRTFGWCSALERDRKSTRLNSSHA